MLEVIRKIIYGIIAISIVVNVWLLWPDHLDQDGVNFEVQETIEIPEYLMHNFRYVSVTGSKREMEVFAHRASFFLEKEFVKGKEILAYIYNIRDEKTRLRSKIGFFDMKGQVLTMEKDVESVSPDGFHVEGEKAIYDMVKRMLKSPVPVYGFSTVDNLKIWGNRAQSDLDANTATFYGDVKTQYVEPQQGDTLIWADKGFVERNKKQLTYWGNPVEIDQRKWHITSKRSVLFYDRMFQKEKQNQDTTKRRTETLKYMACYDDVEIKETDSRFSRSDVAEFYAETDTVALSGYPSAYDGKDTITGDKIILYRGTGVVEVTSTNAAFDEGSFKKESTKPLTDEEILQDEEESELVP